MDKCWPRSVFATDLIFLSNFLFVFLYCVFIKLFGLILIELVVSFSWMKGPLKSLQGYECPVL